MDITKTSVWKELIEQQQKLSTQRITDLFNSDPDRFSNYSFEAADLFLDYSKSFVDDKALQLLIQLAKDAKVKERAQAMFAGEKVNITEQRAVLHTALRNQDPNASLQVDGKDVMIEIRALWQRMEELVNAVRDGAWLSFNGKKITDIVNIGIGGSDLGPKMAVKALAAYAQPNMRYHFVSNIDGSEISEVFKAINPETTLFIVASKTFTTQETLANANTARQWFLEKTSAQSEDVKRHFVAVTANPKGAKEFGIDSENIFPFWNWVGGRFSLWSSIGLIIALAIGMDNFREFLAGAHAMDEHFITAPLDKNMPTILALLAIWYGNFWNAQTYAVLPYDHYLQFLPQYLQQLEMESNGKSVNLNGQKVDFKTAPIVWGSPGINGQHAFHQLLMQGTHMVPADFILPMHSLNPVGDHHQWLIANCLAQSKALMEGRNAESIKAEIEEAGLTSEEITKLIPHKLINGNVPSNTVLLSKLTPKTLGSLIALYEHKVFVMGAILNINSFDQWGVELGKKLAKKIVPMVQEGQALSQLTSLDASTQGLLNKIVID